MPFSLTELGTGAALLGLVSGCAGPTTPLGPATETSAWLVRQEASYFTSNFSSLNGPEVAIEAGIQGLTIQIRDPGGIAEPIVPSLRVRYDGIDVTDGLLSRAEVIWIHPTRLVLKLATQLSQAPHRIEAEYAPSPTHRAYAKWQP